jgi:multiple sugar transport system permease protein/putative aldouronate transport system permease protein
VAAPHIGRIMANNQSTATRPAVTAERPVNANWRKISVNWQLYLLCVLPIAWLIIFMYLPMYGNLIAFKRYVPTLGVLGSPWVGFDNFIRFFKSYRFFQVLWNTFYLSFYDLLVGFPIPIVLALVLHYMPIAGYKKTVQMVTYAPHFISTVVMVGIIFKLGSQRIGLVNVMLAGLGLPEVNFLGSSSLFAHVFVWTNVWQQMGWGTIIFLAALSAVDPELHESATVDGASIWQRMRHIDIPGILPTVIILLILRAGMILQVGFEKVFLLQNNLNIEASEVIQTYVYKIGIASRNPNFHYATAIGLFQNVVMFLMLIVVNRIARRVSDTSLW